MRGQKYDTMTKEKALAMMATNNNLTEVSRQLNIPVSTLESWKKEALTKDDEFARVRSEKKKEFIQTAWRIIEKGSKILEKKMTEADTDLEKADMRAISTVLGTIYDKQALASAEPTQIVEGKVEMIRFEDL